MRTEEEIRLLKGQFATQLEQMHRRLREQKPPGAWQMSQIALMETKIEVLRWTLAEVEQVPHSLFESF